MKMFRRQFIRHFFWTGGLSALLALALTACGPSQSAAPRAPAAVVHGEPIRGEAGAPAAIAAAPPAPVAAAGQSAQCVQPTSPARVTAIPAAAKSASVQTVLNHSASIASAPSSTAPARLSAPGAPQPVAAIGGYAVVGFDKLAAYNFEVDDAPFTNIAAADKANDQIPAPVKALDDRKISLKGFMLPLKVADGTVTEFLIMKDQSTCCYGAVPKINEWVSVKAAGKGVKPIMDQPISILGTLHVGAMRENGYLVGIYQMDGDKLVAPEN